MVDPTVLAGAHGVEPLRRLALDPLRQHPELRLIRTKYKPARKLSAYYVRPDGSHEARVWTPESVTRLVSPDDPALPQLAELHRRESGHVEIVRYRPGQRHVLRIQAAGRPSTHVKIDRDDSGARSVPIAAALGPYLADRCPDASVAEPVEYLEAERAAVWLTSPGEPLRQHLDEPTAHLLGRSVRSLHEFDSAGLPETADGAGPRDGHAEAAATLRAGEHIAALLPGVGADYRARVDEVSEALGRIPAEPPTFTHGDLKTDNMLAAGGRVRILDLDRSGTADPALDLGKLVADIGWWYSGDRAQALVSAFRSGYGESGTGRWERAMVLAGLFHLKLTARRCAVHDADWESQVGSRVAELSPLLARGA